MVDNSDSKNDDKNFLDDIMNEDESSEASKKSSKKKSQEKPVKEFNEDDEISEDERKRILDEIDLDSDDDEDEEESSQLSAPVEEKIKDSISDDSIQDLTNKSIDSGPSELQDVVDQDNYLPFISDKYELKTDVLEVIDRNERSFKMVAEKMIQKSSQLDNVAKDEDGANRRLMHFKLYDQIANRFHGDVKV